MSQLELRTHASLSEVPEEAWQGLERFGNPFLDWRFLQALEDTRCVCPERGWAPCHLTLSEGSELVAAAPAYVKDDGMGDFSRDWGFQELIGHLGGSLYPKLVLGIPFSPVTGPRFLVRKGFDRTAAIGGLLELAKEAARRNDFASVQVLYHLAEERPALRAAELAERIMIQYHWSNRGYPTFEAWLSALPSKKRTQIRRERREPERQGIAIRTVRAAELSREELAKTAALAHRLYRSTTEKYMWGGAYLNRAMIGALFERLSDHVELVLAEREGAKASHVVAGALNFASATHLYGRYWGCFEEHRFLHFNVCLYHSIEDCIARGLSVFEGGAGGEHKLARGFDPEPVWCAHWFADARVQHGVARALRVDGEVRLQQIREYRERKRLPRVDW
ncbi:MAG TPA: GNAT family N-acetyltransferase [Thermoanaerobaculia bacterium]|nr:GNAT family N-acetyltransferase [Thermoanaerobaculia bacterium]